MENNKKIIISLTTIPSRVDILEKVLDSLINQEIKPDKIFINIPKKYQRFDEIFKVPKFLNKDKFKKMVSIFYLDKDYGPATKFIGSLLNKNIKNDDLLVITDDDVVKTKKWLKLLIDNHKNNRITSFVKGNLGKEILWGYLGYIFKKKLINKKDVISFYNNIKKECNFVDDHWFTGYCHYKKIDIYNIPIMFWDINYNFKHGDSNDSLVNLLGDNKRKIISEKCRKIIKDKYNTEFPFWCCFGCCPYNNSGLNKYDICIIVMSLILLVLIILIINIKMKNKII